MRLSVGFNLDHQPIQEYLEDELDKKERDVLRDVDISQFGQTSIIDDEVAGEELKSYLQTADEDVRFYQILFLQENKCFADEGVDKEKKEYRTQVGVSNRHKFQQHHQE